MKDITPEIACLHAYYCAVTDRAMTMSVRHMHAWEIWLAKGFTKEDVTLVVRYLKHLIKLERRRPESFRFHNFVENTDRFAEDLAEAKAWARGPKMDNGKSSVLRATGRPTETNDKPPRSAASIIAGDKALKELLKARDNL